MKTLEEAIKHWEKVAASQCNKEYDQLAKWLKELQVHRNKAKRVYISAPITGYDLDERVDYFQGIEDRLIKEGYEVANPMKNGLPLDAPYKEQMKSDIEMLRACDMIFLYGDWKKSKGCMTEYSIAKQMSILVIDTTV